MNSEAAATVESSIEDVNEVTRSLKVSIPADMVDREYESAMLDVVKGAQLKGFRPGKAPRNMVEKLHGGRVRLEVANRLISSTLRELVSEHKLDMVGLPDIDVGEFKAGASIDYTANISVLPRPEISGYDKFSVEVTERTADDKAVDAVVERLRNANAGLKRIELRNTGRRGDVFDCSVVITVEGEKPSRPEPLTFELGKGVLPDEVEKAMEGLEVSSSCDVQAVVPAHFPNEGMRGKQARWVVTLNALFDRELPEFTDEFVKTLGLGIETILELRMKIREDLEAENKKLCDQDVETAVLKQLSDSHQFMVPQAIVDDQIRSLLVRIGVIDPSKVDPSDLSMESFRERFGEMALQRARTTVIVDRIVEQEKLLVSESEINEGFEKLAAESGVELNDVKRYFQEGDRMAVYAIDLSRSKALAMLRDRAKVKFVKPARDSAEAPLE